MVFRRSGSVLALGFFIGAGAHGADKVHVCPQPGGGTVLSQTPCRPLEAPPRPPDPPPCPLTAEQLRSAEKREFVFRQRYPDEPAHRDALLAELRPVAARIGIKSARFAELVRERRRIDDELEFYRGKSPPSDLARRLDANEAQFAALVDLFRDDEHAVRALDAKFACERTTFGALWRGGAAGSSACAPACPAARP